MIALALIALVATLYSFGSTVICNRQARVIANYRIEYDRQSERNRELQNHVTALRLALAKYEAPPERTGRIAPVRRHKA